MKGPHPAGRLTARRLRRIGIAAVGALGVVYGALWVSARAFGPPDELWLTYKVMDRRVFTAQGLPLPHLTWRDPMIRCRYRREPRDIDVLPVPGSAFEWLLESGVWRVVGEPSTPGVYLETGTRVTLGHGWGCTQVRWSAETRAR